MAVSVGGIQNPARVAEAIFTLEFSLAVVLSSVVPSSGFSRSWEETA